MLTQPFYRAHRLAAEHRSARIENRSARIYNRGLTLIELLVAATLMLILVLISIPAVKPMLDSNKQRQGADTLSTFLTQARLRAMETGRPCGVRFERYTDLNQGGTVFPYNNACLVLRQVEVPPPYCGCSSTPFVAVNPSSGALTIDTAEEPYWNQFVKDGDLIQFDNQGFYYKVNLDPTNIPPIYVSANDPEKPLKLFTAPVPFKVLRSPQPTLTAPVGFPTGIVVDLRWSGEEKADPFILGGGTWALLGDEFVAGASGNRDHVMVMFSPSGSIERVYSGSLGSSNLTTPLFFLIGKWERSGRDYTGGTDYLPDDKLYNFDDVTNYWVKVEPGGGKVSTFSVAPSMSPTTMLSQLPNNGISRTDADAWIRYYESTRRYGK
ncbi:MAG: pilus assembly FimT family protein [Thermoguttaceae bacterium]